MPPILDLAIGLIFIFLLFSTVVSAFNELILSTLDKRSQFLKEGLGELLANPEMGEGGAVDKILKHGLVDSLSRNAAGKTGQPAYLPPNVFVSALLDQLVKADVNKDRTINDLKAAIGNLPEGKLKQSLTAIFTESGQDLASFRSGLEDWFNQSMKRVSGWYKRCAQKWMFWLGLGLAIACNVDSVHIIQALSSDPKLRQSLVTQAVQTAQQHAGLANSTGQNPAASPAPAPAQVAELTNSLGKFERSVAAVEATGVPVGWGEAQLEYFEHENGSTDCSRVFLAFFGWLVTALACTLGAPFWFDTLNRFVNLRSNGLAPGQNASVQPARPTPPPSRGQTVDSAPGPIVAGH